MKRIVMFSIILWVVLFVLSMVTTQSEESNLEYQDDDIITAAAVTEPTSADSGQVFDKEHTVTVKRDDQIVEIRLDRYLAGVVAAEMPAAFPEEALKAQAVAARTFVLRREAESEAGGKSGHDGAVICTDPGCCMAYRDLSTEAVEVFGANAQAYSEKIEKAVSDTDGIIMTYDGVPILAAFHAIAGGQTENAADVWGSDVPYLVSVPSEGEENAAQYYGEVTVTTDEFRTRFLAAYPKAVLSDDPMEWFTQPVYTDSGRIKTVTVGGETVSGIVLRSMFSLNSTNFKVQVGTDDAGADTITFHTTGYGHGVGMSQYGAMYLAQNGSTYEEILQKYYTGVTISSCA